MLMPYLSECTPMASRVRFALLLDGMTCPIVSLSHQRTARPIGGQLCVTSSVKCAGLLLHLIVIWLTFLPIRTAEVLPPHG
jgi:hypothetical protein